MHRHIYISLMALFMMSLTTLSSADVGYIAESTPQSERQSSNTVLTAQRRISASEAKSIARKRVRGAEVIDISLNGNSYKVRMQKKNGHVVDVYVDATTGRVR